MRTLEVIQNEVQSCTKCNLHSTRTNTVFARGNSQAAICIVGEAPGEDEDLQGLPFVGRSGKLLDKLLLEAGLDIENDIYICNILKCRPPGNRRPTDVESNCCLPYLEEQLALVYPRVLIVLGNTAVSNLLGLTEGISKVRGRFFNWYFQGQKTLAMPTYHPSYLLRNGSDDSEPRKQFRQDIAAVLDKIKEPA
jgi:uracil-DNA glycosylase family 4